CDQLIADDLLCKVVQKTDRFTIKFGTQDRETIISNLENLASQISRGLTACISEKFALIINGYYDVNSCTTMEAKLSVF
ncbi:MAG: hypothetical protein ACHQK8_07755, partial [Bacteroidia bacterium]